MPDARFYISLEPVDVEEAVRLVGAEWVRKRADVGKISRAAAPNELGAYDAVIFAESPARVAALSGKRFGLCLVPPALADATDGLDGAVASVKNPRAAFADLAARLHRLKTIDDGPAPAIDRSANVHPAAVLGAGVVIGARTIIGPHVSIECAIIGDDCVIAPGAAIGGQGFGFGAGAHGLRRAPHLGRVIIGRAVEIGANCCVDRGSLGDTVIEDGVKIDNLVQVAHNVRIGAHTVIAALAGIAGSSSIGARCQIGGQVGIASHLTIGDDARIAAQSGLMRDIPAGETWGGAPAQPMMTWMREIAALSRLAQRKKKASDHDD